MTVRLKLAEHLYGSPGVFVDLRFSNAMHYPPQEPRQQHQLIVCGINHHSAPISVRERFAIPADSMASSLLSLIELPHVEEAAILATCNRTEIYAVVDDVERGLQEMQSFLDAALERADRAESCASPKPDFKLFGDDVALHLFRVASGLDSMVMGEGQILGQLRSAHRAAVEMRTAGSTLSHTFDLAIKCGRRVRSETNIGRRAVSLSSAALEAGRAALGSLRGQNVLVLGAGEMAQRCLRQLLSADRCGTITVVNRSHERLHEFVQSALAGKPPSQQERLQCWHDFDERHALAAEADLVIVATAAPEPVLTRAALTPMRRRSLKPLCIIDLSVPRNVDCDIVSLPGVTVSHVDDLARIVETNLAEREALAQEADEIIFDELERFQKWWRLRAVSPAIAKARRRLEEICRGQTEKAQLEARALLSQDSLVRRQMEKFGRAIVAQILHELATSLKAGADLQSLQERADAVESLFESVLPVA